MISTIACTARLAARWLTVAAACGMALAGYARAISFQFDAPAAILTSEDMERNGILFPDGIMWFVRKDGVDQYYVSGAGGTLSGAGKTARLPHGTYKFAGSLDKFVPAKLENGRPAYSLADGRKQPSPDGSDFDRDYAGGGPTYLFNLGTGRGPVFLQIYHGEYHLLPNKGLPGYGASGMAISYDGGDTFEKIGQIVSPHLSRTGFFDEQVNGGMWADGAMVEANADGHRESVPAGGRVAQDAQRYFFMIFTDHNEPRERYVGLSIARVRKADLLEAIRQRKAPIFRKYYNPSGAVTFEKDFFTEPGIGGRSTPILFNVGQYIGSPGVVYDSYLRGFVLFYQTNQKQIILRTSENLLQWSDPVTAFSLDASSDLRVFYPSVAGKDVDPEVPGQTFYLYFLVRERPPTGPFLNSRLMREQVKVTP